MEKNKEKISLKRVISCYIQASRLEGGFIASVFLLLGIWYSNQSFPIFKSILGIISINLIVNSGSIINYVFDKEVDVIAGKNIGFFDYISTKKMLVLSIVISIIGVIILFYISIISFIFGLILFYVFYVYASPPLRLKIIPPFDIFLNGLGFGLIPFLIGWSILEKIPHRIIPFYTSFICGMIVISYYLLISSFDIDSDKEAGIQTSCTVLGFNRTLYVGIFIFIFGLLLSFYNFFYFFIISVSLIICLPVMILMIIKKDIDFIQKAVSIVYLLWAGSILFLLFYFSKSVIPGILILILFILIIQVFLIYLKKENIK